MFSFTFQAIGTTWVIDIYNEIDTTAQTKLVDSVKNRIETFEKNYSRFRSDSLVADMAKRAGQFTMPDDALPMLSLYEDLYRHTDGLVTPLIGQVLSDAGYDAHYSLQPKKVITQAPLLFDLYSYKHPILSLSQPVQFDFGAIGKGYLIDIVGRLLEEHSITAYCIDAGHDILQKNNTPMRIGLEHPLHKEQVIGVYELQNQSICGSSSNRRAWRNFTHIINPKTGVSPDHIAAVWAVADSAIVADAMTTCLFFSEPEYFTDNYHFEYLILYKDLSIKKSAGFSADLFLK